MTKKWHETKAFLAERKKWYDKLEAEGFNDVELTDWRTGEAWERTKGIAQQEVCERWSPEAERYYQLANQYLWELRRRAHNDRRRKNPTHRDWKRRLAVWKLHAAGLGVREIGRRVGISHNTAWRMVRDIGPGFREWIKEENRKSE